MNIGVDIDGVLADLGISLCEVVQEKYHTWIAKECIFTYDIGYCLGISKEKAREVICEAMLKEVPEISEASTSVQELAKKHTIYIVTNRKGYCSNHTTIRWLNIHKIPRKRIIWSKDAIHSKGLQLDVLIDDFPSKLMEWGKDVKYRLLFSQPWNDRVLDVHNEFVRVFDWEDVLEEIKRIDNAW